MKLDLKQRFSWDLEAGLKPAERLANLKMMVLRDQIAAEGNHNLTIQNFFENKVAVEDSKLFKMINAMPKGANQSVHSMTHSKNTASESNVYYS